MTVKGKKREAKNLSFYDTAGRICCFVRMTTHIYEVGEELAPPENEGLPPKETGDSRIAPTERRVIMLFCAKDTATKGSPDISLSLWVIPHKSGEMSATQTKRTARPRMAPLGDGDGSPVWRQDSKKAFPCGEGGLPQGKTDEVPEIYTAQTAITSSTVTTVPLPHRGRLTERAETSRLCAFFTISTTRTVGVDVLGDPRRIKK